MAQTPTCAVCDVPKGQARLPRRPTRCAPSAHRRRSSATSAPHKDFFTVSFVFIDIPGSFVGFSMSETRFQARDQEFHPPHREESGFQPASRRTECPRSRRMQKLQISSLTWRAAELSRVMQGRAARTVWPVVIYLEPSSTKPIPPPVPPP
jgi:hypothetical protein